VNCHLAAGQSQTIHRNNDASAIIEAAILPSETNLATRHNSYVGGGDGSMVLDHEICVLNGDLNYRIETMGRDTVIKAIHAQQYNRLLERDQLLVSRRRNPGFRLRDFQESPILFAPTYKYDLGTDDYDSSEKRRAPAWCDRILYRGSGKVEQLEYRRHELQVSDHRPVSGVFVMSIKRVILSKRKEAWEACEERFQAFKRKLIEEIKLTT
jgi:endonuclease/exonuclease/phosphatase family metal-dependent hydrolase